jgi:hypothetical protein
MPIAEEDRLLCRDVAAGLLREKLLLEFITETWWVVSTMEEDVAPYNLADALAVLEVPKPPRNMANVLRDLGLVRGQVDVEEDYAPPFTPLTVQRLRARALRIRNGEYLRWGIDINNPPRPPGAPPPVAIAGAGAVVPGAGGGVPAVAIPAAAGNEIWLTTVKFGAYNFGDVYPVNRNANGIQVVGSYALITIAPAPNEEIIVCRRVPAGSTAEQFKETLGQELYGHLPDSVKIGETDLRTHSVRYDQSGTRFRPFREGLDLLSTTEFPDFPVAKPRTTYWCVRFVLDNGMTFTGRVAKFKTDGNLSDNSEGMDAYKVIAEALDKFLTFDHLNISELAGCETLLRYCQLIEDSHRDRFVPKASGSGGTNFQVREEMFLYLGSGERHNIMVCPELTIALGDKLKAQAKIDKSRRDAREERRLLKPDPKEKK